MKKNKNSAGLRAMRKFLYRQLIASLAFLIGIAWVPYAWNARHAARVFEGDAAVQAKLANGVEFWLDEELDRADFTTGSKLFDGEWLYGAYMMAALGFGQMADQHPADRERYLALMERCIDELLADRVRAFDAERWRSDPLESLDTNEGHAVYLGYLNLAMSFHRALKPDSKFAALNDQISDALRRRVEASPSLLLESYPRETYPVDNCAVIASIALNGRVRGVDDSLPLRWAGRCRRKYMDPASGLLFQAVDGATGAPYGFPRGSGTTLGLYLLSFMDARLSEDLYEAVERELRGSFFGFGLMREYPKTVRGQYGDIDSGMVIFGYGLSPTGFALGGARLHDDADTFKHLYATANAAGAPLWKKDRINFVTGASLGDAILFAMLTAKPGGFQP